MMRSFFPLQVRGEARVRRRTEKGFALVAVMMFMVMLGLLTIAMLSLSSISLRSSGQSSRMSEARANARMALMLAIGQLQAQLGPDQRVSANGAILSDSNVNHPMWTGVWDSWKAGATASAGDPVSDHRTIPGVTGSGMSPTYLTNRSDHFRSWLLSLDPKETADITSAKSLVLDGKAMPGDGDTAIRLVGEGSLGTVDPAGYVSARLLSVKSPAGSTRTGRYGWWVGDESQKARVMSDSYSKETSLSLAQKIARTQAPASTGTKVIPDLEDITAVQEAKLVGLPSLNSLDVLVENAAKQPAKKNFHTVTNFSKAVLADVREGGLKRDLSTILERTIDPNEVYILATPPGLEGQFKRAQAIKPASASTPGGDDFMLYRFDSMVQSSVGQTGEASVPIQDLAAYYQLYDHNRTGWKGGIQFSSNQSSPSNNLLTGGIMVSNPDYDGSKKDNTKYLRQTGAVYRSVYPVKLEFVLSYLTEQRTQAEMDKDKVANPDTHKLKIGFTPAMTFWNPNNVPVVMNFGDPELYSIMITETPVPMQVDFRKQNGLAGATVANKVVQFSELTNTNNGELYNLFISGRQPLVFEPGESKVLALQACSNTNPAAGLAEIDFSDQGNGNYIPEQELVPGWNPGRFVRPKSNSVNILTFKDTDYISAEINAGTGRTFDLSFTQKSSHPGIGNAYGSMLHYQTYGLRMRMFPDKSINPNIYNSFTTAFNAAGTAPAGPQIVNTAMNAINIPARSGKTLVNAMQSPSNFLDDLPQAFFYYGMKAATETQEKNSKVFAAGAGRRFPSRPFTHSSVMMPQFIDTISGASLYNNGWNWFYMPLANSSEAPISISSKNYGYYGGGYTVENGTTHVVQQELPVAPPISIAALSHAQLSGYSLSSEAAAAGNYGLGNKNDTEAFRRTTALGFGGLEPRTLQAIGNSYAHPFIPKDKAITTFNRVYYQDNVSAAKTTVAEPYADHSYLVNKALWDEFFFSSITPVPSNNPVFGVPAKSVEDVTRDFLSETKQLPNRRIIPYAGNVAAGKLTTLLAAYSQYKNGFADKIAANMMVEGPFNINSTSEAAWKTLFSSLRGKSVSYLDPKDSISGSIKTTEQTVVGVPVGSGSLANGKSYTGSSSDPSAPEQWSGWRELTDVEITQLAKAMVKQVKLRGPFLSLSEFVNRRLDTNPARTDLSVMGALQAAIDDTDCSINAGFRVASRKFSSAEKTYAGAVFPEAMDGPVAYGSSAYVDQADILRNLAEQLTPRGDTFVIRAYGDSIEDGGKVVARAWCEAVVQRTPDYVDTVDEPQLKQAELTSAANRGFGRKFNVVLFRWLHSSEI